MKFLVFALLALGMITACSESNQNLNQQIDALIAEEQFEEALALLDEQETSPEITELRENTHLQYGIHLIYSADPAQMRENANNALRQFIAVLEINPENEKARAEANQILNIYRTFPDRQPAEDVLSKLEELGFQI